MACLTAVIFFRIAMKWPRLCSQISRTEASDPNMDYGLIRRCNLACATILLFALGMYVIAPARNGVRVSETLLVYISDVYF